MDTIGKFFKMILLYCFSVIQTVAGIFVYYAILSPAALAPNGSGSMFDVNGFVPAVIILIVISLFAVIIRTGPPAVTIIEVILSPLAVVRSLISLVLWFVNRTMPELEFYACYDKKDIVLCYLFYFES